MKLTKHARTELLILCALALGSCDEGRRLVSRDEATDIATDAANDAINESSRIGDLETRIEELEGKLRQ